MLFDDKGNQSRVPSPTALDSAFGRTTGTVDAGNYDQATFPTTIPIVMLINEGCPANAPIAPRRTGRRIRKVGDSAETRTRYSALPNRVRNIGNRLDTDE